MPLLKKLRKVFVIVLVLVLIPVVVFTCILAWGGVYSSGAKYQALKERAIREGIYEPNKQPDPRPALTNGEKAVDEFTLAFRKADVQIINETGKSSSGRRLTNSEVKTLIPMLPLATKVLEFDACWSDSRDSFNKPTLDGIGMPLLQGFAKAMYEQGKPQEGALIYRATARVIRLVGTTLDNPGRLSFQMSSATVLLKAARPVLASQPNGEAVWKDLTQEFKRLAYSQDFREIEKKRIRTILEDYERSPKKNDWMSFFKQQMSTSARPYAWSNIASVSKAMVSDNLESRFNILDNIKKNSSAGYVDAIKVAQSAPSKRCYFSQDLASFSFAISLLSKRDLQKALLQEINKGLRHK